MLYGISFDGASLVSGCRGGVATLLTQLNTHLWHAHCYFHKLNLALVSNSNQSMYSSSQNELVDYIYS